MSLIRQIVDKVFHAEAPGLAHRTWAEPAEHRPRQPPPYERTAMAAPTDVALMLDARAAREGRGAGWRGSLEELLAVLGLDGSAAERSALAAELNLADADDAALYEALVQRLAENGVAAPESFYK